MQTVFIVLCCVDDWMSDSSGDVWVSDSTDGCLLNVPSLFLAHVETGRWKPDIMSYLTLQICINMKWMEQAAENLWRWWGKGVQTKLEATRQPNKTFYSHQTALLHVSVCCYWVIESHCCRGVTHQRLIIPVAARGRGNNISHVWVRSL